MTGGKMIFFADTGFLADFIRTNIKNVPINTAIIDEIMTDAIAHLSFYLKQFETADDHFILFYINKVYLFLKEIKNGYDLHHTQNS